VRPSEIVAWEGRWSRRVAVATVGAVILLVASFAIVSSLGGGGEAASLRSLHDHGGKVALSAALQAIGFLLLVAPLVFLFRAAAARSPKMRFQFLPLVVLAPLALCVASVLNAVAANEAASDFVAGKSTPTLSAKTAGTECRSELKEDPSGFREEFGGGAAGQTHCVARKREDDSAKNAITDSALRTPSQILQLVGAFGLAFALVYSCLYALRAGLLTRLWGSLGIALGVATLLGLFQFTLVWFFYFGLLLFGWVPKGRPPAWQSGEAIPWPTPGEKAAAELDPQAEDTDDESDAGRSG
jgi:hypothetical protein